MKKVTIIIIAISGLILLSSMLYSQETFKIIVNPSNTVSTLSKSQVSELFLKKTKVFNDIPALPVDLESSDAVRLAFTKEIHGKSISAVKAYWQQMIYSGRNVPPPEKASSSEVIAYVLENPGAIGYVSAETNTGNVKVLSITE